MDTGLPKAREKDVWYVMEAAAEAGVSLTNQFLMRGLNDTLQYYINQDHNSGSIMGFSVAGSSSNNKIRTTSASATLPYKPENLKVRVNCPVSKVILDENKVAVGVQLIDGSEGENI